MKKVNSIKLSFVAPTAFLPKRIRLENLNGKIIILIPFSWNRSDYPHVEKIISLLKSNGINVISYTELRNNEFVFLHDGDVADLKNIEVKEG